MEETIERLKFLFTSIYLLFAELIPLSLSQNISLPQTLFFLFFYIFFENFLLSSWFGMQFIYLFLCVQKQKQKVSAYG